MAFCMKCGEKLADGANFCPVCGFKCGESPVSSRTYYQGDVLKCPSCGEVLKAFETVE